MTVAELIEKLQALPQELAVANVQWEHGEYYCFTNAEPMVINWYPKDKPMTKAVSLLLRWDEGDE